MKSAEFPMMKELQSAAREQMSFYNKMMEKKEMNEQIRKLAKQAITDKLTLDEFINDLKLNPNKYWGFTDSELEKFTELIVRECMKESWDEIVSDEDIAQEDDPLIREYLKGYNQGIVDAVIRFRNHFGVEE